MVRAQKSVEKSITNGIGAFLPPASLRQPAQELGPRAQHTIMRIVEATREVFLTHGYAGTTIDEITRIAEVSRASFYTYFPTKREVLLAVGAHSAQEDTALIDELADVGRTRIGTTQWVSKYFSFLDVHGAFAFAWTQAAQNDEEIRLAGMKRHLKICRSLSGALSKASNKTLEQPEILGLTIVALLERLWFYSGLYAGRIGRAEAIEQAAQVIWSSPRSTSSNSTPR